MIEEVKREEEITVYVGNKFIVVEEKTEIIREYYPTFF